MTTETLKSNRGAPKQGPKDDWHVSIDQTTSIYFRAKYLDPLTKTTRKGALSELVNRLLREELARDQASKGPAT